jgi:hypothetical protein
MGHGVVETDVNLHETYSLLVLLEKRDLISYLNPMHTIPIQVVSG